MILQEKYKREIEELVEACHRCANLGYVNSSGGNLSVRVEENVVLITPTKTPKRLMTFNDICILTLDGKVLYSAEGKKPTGETPFHLRIFKNRPDVKGIVHAHPPVITGLSLTDSDILQYPILPEVVLEVGPILDVAYATPLSEELSENFDCVINKSNGFVMKNHGALFCSPVSIFEAVELLEMSESMAKSIVVAKIFGQVNTLKKQDLSNLDDVLKVRSLKIPGGDENLSLVDVYQTEK